MGEMVKCGACHATGRIGEFICPLCGGAGRVERSKAREAGIDIDEECDRA